MNIKNLLKSVDYKGLAMHHCEKVVIVVVTAMLVMFLMNAVKKAMSASDITPDQIAQLADKLTASVRNSRWESSPDRDQVKNPDFETQINQLKNPVDPKQFKLSAPYYFNFVDFGGILRQKPDVLTPYNPIAFADKSAVSLYKTDAKGNIIEEEKVLRTPAKKKTPEEEKDAKKKKKKAATTKPAVAKGGKGSGMSSAMPPGSEGDAMADDMMESMGGMSGMMGGMMNMGAGRRGTLGAGQGSSSDSDFDELGGNIGAGQSSKKSGGSIRRNTSKRDEDDQFADDPPPEKAGVVAAAPGAKPDAKAPITRKVKVEEIRGIRWAVITALVRHREQVLEYIKKLHTPDDPPVYNMVMVERREVLSDGSLSEWASIDWKKEKKLVDLLPEKKRTPERPEFQAAKALFEGLVMPLPELIAGRWAFHDQRAAFNAAVEASTKGVGGGGMDEGEVEGDSGEESQDLLNQGIFSGPGGTMPGRGGADALGGAAGVSGGRSSPGMGLGGIPGASNPPQQDTGALSGRYGQQGARGGRGTGGTQIGAGKAQQPKAVQTSNAEIVQIRFIDYTVDPEHTYQYRLKVVVQNPNVIVGTDKDGKTTYTPRLDIISEDVAKDVAKDETLKTLTSDDWSEPTNPVYVPTDTEYFVLERVKTREEAKLQVHKWPADIGDWQFSDFTIKPGDLIGSEVREYPMVDWEDRLKKIPFDFSTQDLLLDVTGGDKTFHFVVDGVEKSFNEKLPAEIFVIDRLGDLATRNEDFDKYNADRKERESEIKKLRDAADKEPKKGAATKPESGGAEGFDERVPTRKPGG